MVLPYDNLIKYIKDDWEYFESIIKIIYWFFHELIFFPSLDETICGKFSFSFLLKVTLIFNSCISWFVY